MEEKSSAEIFRKSLNRSSFRRIGAVLPAPFPGGLGADAWRGLLLGKGEVDLALEGPEVLSEESIGVELRGPRMVRAFDLLLIGEARHAEQVVEVQASKVAEQIRDPLLLLSREVYGLVGVRDRRMSA